jgi:site-specific DNA-methyltransferase (adenine-specific)
MNDALPGLGAAELDSCVGRVSPTTTATVAIAGGAVGAVARSTAAGCCDDDGWPGRGVYHQRTLDGPVAAVENRGGRPDSPPARRPRVMSAKPAGWTSDNWETPWPVVRDLEREFGPFDLDPCAQPHTAKAPAFYTVDDDGLRLPWWGCVFVNPPYSRIEPWCQRSIEMTAQGRVSVVVMLLPAAVDTAWFHDYVWPYAEVRFRRGRVRFLGWEGTPIPAPRTPSLFAIYRADPLSA